MKQITMSKFCYMFVLSLSLDSQQDQMDDKLINDVISWSIKSTSSLNKLGIPAC